MVHFEPHGSSNIKFSNIKIFFSFFFCESVSKSFTSNINPPLPSRNLLKENKILVCLLREVTKLEKINWSNEQNKIHP